MTTDKIRYEKLQFNINREATLSSGIIDKCEYPYRWKILRFNQRQIIEQAKFAYSPLVESFKKQREKQVDPINFLDIFNKTDELKQVKSIFPQNKMNDLIRAKLKKFFEFQDIIEKDHLNYKSKHGKTYYFGKYSLLIVF